jgi:DNA-binding NtrC family response regulator
MSESGGSVHVTVVDESLTVAQAAQRVFLSSGIKTSFAGTLYELPLVFAANGMPDLLVVNLSEELTGWEVTALVRRTGYRGRILAFVDSLSDTGVRHLEQLRRGQCVVRPGTDAALDEQLQRALPESLLAQPGGPPIGTPAAYHGIIGNSPQMREIFSRIEKVAAGDANVCIHGESGTGKELIARAIHYASPRRDRPLITLDCTTIPEGLMESHLLGHVRGAFTGAVEHREGVFSLAHTGTLFIDELSELSPPLQAKLLRVIQNREFMLVGGTKPIRTDIRLITASNKDLKQEVDKGNFREDLYYRVAVFMVTVPPLRERKDDIRALVDHFLKKFSTQYGKPIRNVEPAAMQRMLTLRWPGNVRQLENFLEQAVVLAEGDTLTERDLFTGDLSVSPPALRNPTTYEPGLPLREVERRHILHTLQKVNGNRTEAARLLGISVRCLQYKLKEYVNGAAM